MRSNFPQVIAALGRVSSSSTWSGIPYFFYQSAIITHPHSHALDVNVEQEKVRRILWNIKELTHGRKGGYQYSEGFLDRMEAQIPEHLWEKNFLSFHQHFPRSQGILNKGGAISRYIDAPFQALVNGMGLNLKLPKKTRDAAIALEKENLESSDHVITMARWAASYVLDAYKVSPDRVSTILPGANFYLPQDWTFRPATEPASKNYDLVLGFVGKDWERKGLPLLLDIQRELKRRGYKVLIKAAGYAPKSLADYPDLEYSGFLDKQTQNGQFADFLKSCDIGCLFSQREALGISTLEFLHAGVPVAGYCHEGLADTLPRSASLSFELNDDLEIICNRFEKFITDSNFRASLTQNAINISPVVTWDRCITEMTKLFRNESFTPVQLWNL